MINLENIAPFFETVDFIALNSDKIEKIKEIILLFLCKGDCEKFSISRMKWCIWLVHRIFRETELFKPFIMNPDDTKIFFQSCQHALEKSWILKERNKLVKQRNNIKFNFIKKHKLKKQIIARNKEYIETLKKLSNNPLNQIFNFALWDLEMMDIIQRG